MRRLVLLRASLGAGACGTDEVRCTPDQATFAQLAAPQ